MKLYCLILFFFLVTTVCCGQKTTIEGLVFNKVDNSPIAFAFVYADDSLIKAQTDFEGKFKIKHVKPGTCNLYVSSFPYFPDAVFKQVEVPVKGKVKVSFPLQAIKITRVENINGKICPICHSDADVIPIVYGLVDLASKEFQGEPQGKIMLGGCGVRDQNWYCKKAHVEF